MALTMHVCLGSFHSQYLVYREKSILSALLTLLELSVLAGSHDSERLFGSFGASNAIKLFAADFGVSARNMKTLQKRDSFIGTPYW